MPEDRCFTDADMIAFADLIAARLCPPQVGYSYRFDGRTILPAPVVQR